MQRKHRIAYLNKGRAPAPGVRASYAPRWIGYGILMIAALLIVVGIATS